MILPLRSLVLACSLFVVTTVWGQDKLSNSTRIALADKDYALINTDGQTHALVLVNALASDSIFKANGIFVNGKFGQVWSIAFDASRFDMVQQLPCISYIELANKAAAARYKNDVERVATSVDKVQAGLQNSLPLNYSGKGVVVGIVIDGSCIVPAVVGVRIVVAGLGTGGSCGQQARRDHELQLVHRYLRLGSNPVLRREHSH